ncbi:MAG: hypothetical protein ACP5N9_03610 [Candidatus Bilamarchaeum sp.]|jgi:hypothetical protein
MHTLETIFSCLFLLIIVTYLISAVEIERSVDHSLLLANRVQDIWQVLELRGDIEKLDETGRLEVESDLDLLGEQTGYCIFIEGVRFTNCRGGSEKDVVFASSKVVVVRGIPRKVSYTITTK